MQTLFEAVRAVCSAEDWSRGVELSRAGVVREEYARADEVLLRVLTHGGMIPPTVTLWPQDKDWSCDCAGRAEACAHVAAAVIALRQGQQAGATPARPSLGKLRYHWTRTPGGLSFGRAIVQDGQVHVLEGTLATVASGQHKGLRCAPTQADMAVELALGPRRRGVIPRENLPKLFTALARCPDVQLDNTPVTISTEPLGLRACLVDAGEGFRLFVERATPVTETFAHGIARCGTTLRLIAETALTAREQQELPEGRYIPPTDVLELVNDILPSLRKRVPIDIQTQRLPKVVTVPPRLVLDTQRDGATLTILPLLVYGDPPTARVDAGQLVHLGGAIPKRDPIAEQHLVQQLRRGFNLVPGHKAQFTGAEAVRFATRLKGWRGEITGNGHTGFAMVGSLTPHVRLEAGQFEVWFDLPGAPARGTSGRRAEAQAVFHAWQAGETLVPLSDGGWAQLPLDWLRQHGQRVADLLAARRTRGDLPRCVLPDLAQLCDALEQPRPPECADVSTFLRDFTGIPPAPLPPDIKATLRPYQQRGVDWLTFLRRARLGALLADDMGLGKTLQALCAMRGRVLVVAPTSVVYHWAEEVQRFRPGLRVAIYHGTQRALDPTAEVTLTTYAILRLDATALTQEPWDTVILDESQTIKNPDSQVARVAYALRARCRIALTGTPVENRLDELWSQFHFLNRGLLGGRQDFQTRYAKPIAEGRPGAAEHLRARIRPFLLRRRKHDVAPELPPRTDVVLPCVLSEEERAVYDTVRAATLPNVVALLEAGGNVLAALEALLRLRQACCHAGLVPGHTAPSSTKVALLVERLEEAVADGHKALVFSQWTALLDRIEPHLRTANIPFTRLDGSTRDRAAVVHEFQADTGPPVMLVSLRAGGIGLNLTAADHIFLLDPWWNPAVEDQAADRAHRIGQTRPVFVYRLVAQATVEERLLALQAHKRLLAAAALDTAEAAAAITREELVALLT